MKCLLFLLLFFVQKTIVFAQSVEEIKWWNPNESQFPVVGGRGWSKDLNNFYDRLPAKAEKKVRKEVWNLSQNTAGGYVSFKTNSGKIVVRYVVSGNKSMSHMPATGVSGVDLYALSKSGKWLWAKGNYSFGDTVVYTFSNISQPESIQEFRLYLPLYNNVVWLQIGVPNKNNVDPLRVSEQKPIVLYGTSIMQGACASRPGLAWTNILGRKINIPIINLGFSGNGRLEPELIDLVNEIDASLYVLDCQPNLHNKNVYSEEEIENRITKSVNSLQSHHPGIPILLVEHCCGSADVSIDTSLNEKYNWTSQVLKNSFEKLKKSGVKNIYILTAEEIGFDASSTVDGTHPNDIGMMKYAEAYEQKLIEILKIK